METKKNISPSIEEAKQRIELYNKMCFAMRDLFCHARLVAQREATGVVATDRVHGSAGV